MQNATAQVGPYTKLAVETIKRLVEVIRNMIPKEAD